MRTLPLASAAAPPESPHRYWTRPLALVAVAAALLALTIWQERRPPARAGAGGDPRQPVAPAAAVAPPAGAPRALEPAPPLFMVFEERFAGNQRHWPDDPQSTAWLAGGGYRLFARQPGRFVAVGAPGLGRLRDVVVTAAFRKVGGPPGGGYGIIVRDQGPGPRDGIEQGGWYYVLAAGDRGEVGVWRREGERWVDLFPWTPSEAVRPGGEPNELTARAIGRNLAFFVNGVQVAGLADVVLAEGSVGLFADGDLNEVLIERFAVQVPH